MTERIILRVFHPGQTPAHTSKSSMNGAQDLAFFLKPPAKLSARRQELFGVLTYALVRGFVHQQQQRGGMSKIDTATYRKAVESLKARLAAKSDEREEDAGTAE